jgi:hypothetical protein
MKVSDITSQLVAEYLRLDYATMTAPEKAELQTILDAATAFVVSYTGQTEDALDDFPDVVLAVYVLCQDMYDTRSYYVDKSNVNKVVEAILGMHCINLL